MWQVLGIEATDDPSAIRRAYAARLKVLDPDREPEAFRALRRAYESALARAEQVARRRFVARQAEAARYEEDHESEVETRPTEIPAERVNAVDGSGVEIRPLHDSDVLLASAVHESAAARKKFQDLLEAQDWPGAATELVSASARGLLPLMDEEALAAELMTCAVADRGLTPEALRGLAHQLRWDEPLPWSRGPHDALRQQVRIRLDAEAWYERVVAQAAYQPPGGLNLHARLWGDPKQLERTAAAMLLGRAPARNAPFFKKWLDPLLDQAERYQASLQGRLDPTLIAALRTTVAPVKVKRKSRVGIWIWILALIGLAHLVGLLVNSN